MPPTTTQPMPCYFLKVPIELRLQIYEKILTSFAIPNSSNLTPNPTTAYLHPLLNICTQIRAEAAKPYHRRLHKILDEAFAGISYVLDELREWDKRPIMGSVWHMQQEQRMIEAYKLAVAWYKRVLPVVNGEIVLARGKMEGTRAVEREMAAEMGKRDVFGDWYSVSVERETYERGKEHVGGVEVETVRG